MTCQFEGSWYEATAIEVYEAGLHCEADAGFASLDDAVADWHATWQEAVDHGNDITWAMAENRERWPK